jgi:predicted nucleic acid-binding protein
MNAAIVDTDVVSTLFKGDTRARAYRPHVTGRLLGISFMTLAELERWSLERDWGLKRRLELAQHLTRYAVLPVSRIITSAQTPPLSMTCSSVIPISSPYSAAMWE